MNDEDAHEKHMDIPFIYALTSCVLLDERLFRLHIPSDEHHCLTFTRKRKHVSSIGASTALRKQEQNVCNFIHFVQTAMTKYLFLVNRLGLRNTYPNNIIERLLLTSKSLWIPRVPKNLNHVRTFRWEFFISPVQLNKYFGIYSVDEQLQ